MQSRPDVANRPAVGQRRRKPKTRRAAAEPQATLARSDWQNRDTPHSVKAVAQLSLGFATASGPNPIRVVKITAQTET
jgi:hypothetical protein